MKNGLKNLIWLLLPAFLIAFLPVRAFPAGEIRKGGESAIITVEGNFDKLPDPLEYYNYKAVFTRVDYSRIAVNVESRYREIKDVKSWRGSFPEEIPPFFYKNENRFPEIDRYFNGNIFRDDDSFINRLFKIFSWLNTNVKYQIVPGNEGEDPRFVFKNKSGDCYGYTVMTVYLLRLSGIPAKPVFSYLYDKKGVDGISGDYFHSLVSVYHPIHGWILWEPQKIFLNVTSDHIPIFNEEDQPKSVIKYFEDENLGMRFASGEDEDSFKKNEFLEIFIDAGRDGKEKKTKNAFEITDIYGKEDFKFIASESSFWKDELLSKIKLPDSKNFMDYILMDKSTGDLFQLEYEEENDLIKYSNTTGRLYVYDDGNSKYIFGLERGDYNIFYRRHSLPVGVYSLRMDERTAVIKKLDVGYLLEEGKFNSVDIIVGDQGEIPVSPPRNGFIFVKELQYDDKLPIFIDYTEKYFFIFGVKKGPFSFRMNSGSGTKLLDLK